MRRGLWFAAGAGVGVYGMVRVRRVKEALSRDGLSDRWHALALGARLLRDEVAHGQAEAETELRERYGLVPHGTPELVAAGRRAVVSTGSTSSTSSTSRTTQEGEN